MQSKAEFESGIGEIDSQHQTIIQLVTEFEAAIEANAGSNELLALVTRAREYAKFHFAVEESLMQIFKYPRFSAHRSEHRFVLEKIVNLEGRVLRAEEMNRLVPQFRIWLLGHFLDSDRHFVEFMRTAAPMLARAEAPIDAVPDRTDTEALVLAMRRAVDQEQNAMVTAGNRETGARDWIAWDSLVATKYAAMDADHRQLVNLFNKLGDAVMAGKSDRECIPLLDDIIRHTREHFAFEERLMQAHAYPQAAEHAAEHAMLINQVLKYRGKLQAGSSGSYIPLIDFPDDWLGRHIARMDRPLGEFLAYIG